MGWGTATADSSRHMTSTTMGTTTGVYVLVHMAVDSGTDVVLSLA